MSKCWGPLNKTGQACGERNCLGIKGKCIFVRPEFGVDY